LLKKMIAFLVVLTLLAAVVGCNNGQDKGTYQESTYIYSGGGDQNNANLKDLSVALTKDTDEVVLTFRFVNGSSITTGTETDMQGLPPYQIAFLQNPTRMMLTVENLQFWDYQVNSSWSDSSGLVQGMFRLVPINSLTGTTFYFNLSEGVRYKVEESDGKLVVTLKKQTQEVLDGYYVTGNLFYEFQEGQLTEGAGLTPTLCNDKISVIMISSRFEKQEDAESFRTRIMNSYSSGLSGKELNIVQQKNNVLPSYDDEMDLQAVLNRTILKIDGKETSLPLFFADARFLCWMPDGKKALFAKPMMVDKTEGVPAVQLYLADQDGMKTLLFDAELADISKAAFSDDGKKLAFVEQSGDIQLCSVFNMETKEVTVLGEDIFGGNIEGIAWNSDGTKLYAMAGTDMLVLREYDIASKTAVNITNYPGVATILQCIDNYLYFVDVMDNVTSVVKMNIETGDFTSLVAGETFDVSANGRYIAVMRPDVEADEGYGSLVLFDTVENKETVIAQNMIVGTFFFNSDSTRLYYVADNTAADAGQFVYSIYQYDILAKANTHLADSTKGTFSESNLPHQMIINVMYTKKDGDYPATYVAKFQ